MPETKSDTGLFFGVDLGMTPDRTVIVIAVVKPRTVVPVDFSWTLRLDDGTQVEYIPPKK